MTNDDQSFSARVEAAVTEHVDELLRMTPAEIDADFARCWGELPPEMRRAGLSLARYVRLRKMDAPEVVQAHERKILRRRVEELRTLLSVFAIELDKAEQD